MPRKTCAKRFGLTPGSPRRIFSLERFSRTSRIRKKRWRNSGRRRGWMLRIPNPTWRWPESCTRWDERQKQIKKYKLTCVFVPARSPEIRPYRAGNRPLKRNATQPKRIPAGWRKGENGYFFGRLELDPSRELNCAGRRHRVGPASEGVGRTIAVDVGHECHRLAAVVSALAGQQVVIVERVEEVGFEPEIHLFSDPGVFGERDVKGLVGGAIDVRHGLAGPCISERREVGFKSVLVEVSSPAGRIESVASMRLDLRPGFDSGNAALAELGHQRGSCARRGVEGEGCPILPAPQRAHLPSADKNIRCAGVVEVSLVP